MLSYRHAFHAGNHADVFKHLVELALLKSLNLKDKAWWYIDTHAGAGGYDLRAGYATKNAEFATGIERLFALPNRESLPPMLSEYLDLIQEFNASAGKLSFYPGSPWFAERLRRATDQLWLFELHPSDFPLLQQQFNVPSKQVMIERVDGFKRVVKLLPPAPRRGLILIDPPYEDKNDYARVYETLSEALKRFASGIYALWIPELQRPEVAELKLKLKTLPTTKGWLEASLYVKAPAAEGLGMHGSTMFIINPSWQLEPQLKATLPILADTLAQDASAHYELKSSNTEYLCGV